MEKTIKEIEMMRDGLTEAIVKMIDYYEKESGMYVEDLKILDDGSLVIFDRLDCNSLRDNTQ